MLLRQAEQHNTAGRGGDFQTVDALFPRVRFLGPKGSYEAGRIDFAMWNDLPFDAESIIAQLVFWRPFDDRLYWQYGELLNARGRVDFAYRILNDLFSVRQRTQQREIQQHYRILRAAQGAPESTNPMVPDWGVWVGGPRSRRTGRRLQLPRHQRSAPRLAPRHRQFRGRDGGSRARRVAMAAMAPPLGYRPSAIGYRPDRQKIADSR